LAQFREAAQIDSTLAWPHGGAADCLRQLGRVAEARAEARTAIRLKPEIPGGYVVLAWTFIQQNAYDSALAYAHQLVHHAPQYAEGWVLEGTMAYYEDQPAEARRAFGTALRLEPRILEHNPEGQRIWHALGAK
jgi:Flp pilus assembly protein TadD